MLTSRHQNVFTNHLYLIYMYKQNLALNNLKWLICHKTSQTKLIEKTLTGITTLIKDGPGSNGSEDVLHTPQITRASPPVSHYFFLVGGLTSQ